MRRVCALALCLLLALPGAVALASEVPDVEVRLVGNTLVQPGDLVMIGVELTNHGDETLMGLMARMNGEDLRKTHTNLYPGVGDTYTAFANVDEKTAFRFEIVGEREDGTGFRMQTGEFVVDVTNDTRDAPLQLYVDIPGVEGEGLLEVTRVVTPSTHAVPEGDGAYVTYKLVNRGSVPIATLEIEETGMEMQPLELTPLLSGQESHWGYASLMEGEAQTTQATVRYAVPGGKMVSFQMPAHTFKPTNYPYVQLGGMIYSDVRTPETLRVDYTITLPEGQHAQRITLSDERLGLIRTIEAGGDEREFHGYLTMSMEGDSAEFQMLAEGTFEGGEAFGAGSAALRFVRPGSGEAEGWDSGKDKDGPMSRRALLEVLAATGFSLLLAAPGMAK